jgi:hypothetical protein
MKILTKIDEILLNNMPTFFEEQAIETIRTTGSVWFHMFNNVGNFFHRERFHLKNPDLH